VPVADRESEVILHALAKDDAIRLIPAKGERIGAVGAFVANRLVNAEEAAAHVMPPADWMSSCRALHVP
jgi:hypothetical protein